jgi:predicted neuraminidase
MNHAKRMKSSKTRREGSMKKTLTRPLIGILIAGAAIAGRGAEMQKTDFRFSNVGEINNLGNFEKRFDFYRYEEYAREAADAALRPTPLRADPSFRYYPDVDDYVLSSSMDRTPGGRIWLAWYGGGDNDRSVLLLAKSDDDGKTFSEPRFVLDAGYIDRTHISTSVACLWTAPDGRLWLFFNQNLGCFDGRSGTWYTICADPDADAPVWSPPVRIWHGSVLNKPTVLADGTWVLSIQLWDREKIGIDLVEGYRVKGSRLFHELDEYRMSNIFVSRDQGKSWTRVGGCLNEVGRTFDEPMLVERRDGSWYLLQRTKTGISESVSTDGGRTWSKPVPFQLPTASSRFFIRRLASGKLLLVKNSNPEDPAIRSHMTAYLSDDDGRSWYGGLLLDDGVKVSYPDGFQAPDGRIFIQYDHNRKGGKIVMAIFTEADVAAGKPVSGRTVLRHSIIRTGRALLEEN